MATWLRFVIFSDRKPVCIIRIYLYSRYSYMKTVFPCHTQGAITNIASNRVSLGSIKSNEFWSRYQASDSLYFLGASSQNDHCDGIWSMFCLRNWTTFQYHLRGSVIYTMWIQSWFCWKLWDSDKIQIGSLPTVIKQIHHSMYVEWPHRLHIR